LRSSNEPIKALAQDCGFTDVPHFTRLFTRRYSTPPAAYRCEAQLLETNAERNSRRAVTASQHNDALIPRVTAAR
jgi:AraC-like DNA-binding protein